MTHNNTGTRGESATAAWLRSKGLNVSRMKYHAPYDLLVNGWRCEVKSAPINAKGSWSFNIHRHGKTTEDSVDFYIFVLENVPFVKAALYLVKKAPLGTPTFVTSVRTLLFKHTAEIQNIEMLRNPAPGWAEIGGKS